MTWSAFIRMLDREIAWDHPTPEQNLRIETALRDVFADKSAIINRCHQVVNSDALFHLYKAHLNYPSKIMDVFVLYLDPVDRFSVRLHRFRGLKQKVGVASKLHSHDWGYSTLGLKGSYREMIYRVNSIDERAGTAALTLHAERVLTPGCTQSGYVEQAHILYGNDDPDDCVTLFVRGTPQRVGFRKYNLEAGTYKQQKDSFDSVEDVPDHILKQCYLRLGELDTDF